MCFKDKPLYPFGFGSSYTTFKYSNLKSGSKRLAKDGTATVGVKVQNSGKVAGDEVVQLYVKHLKSKVGRPVKELRGFRRVALQPGETKTVELPFPAKSLAYWDTSRQAFVVEPDTVEISVGGSSADTRLKTRVAVQ
jgi:beta-glucosidase